MQRLFKTGKHLLAREEGTNSDVKGSQERTVNPPAADMGDGLQDLGAAVQLTKNSRGNNAEGNRGRT